METIVNKDIELIEDEKEVNLILERYQEAKDGKTKSIDESIKDFMNRRELWKNLV